MFRASDTPNAMTGVPDLLHLHILEFRQFENRLTIASFNLHRHKRHGLRQHARRPKQKLLVR